MRKCASCKIKLNELSLNIKKSNFIIFAGRGRRYVRGYARVSVDGKYISQVSHTRFLGTLVDEKLNWKKHINLIRNKTVKSLGIFSKLQSFIKEIFIRYVYFYIFYSCLILPPTSFNNFFKFNSQIHSYNTKQVDHLHLPWPVLPQISWWTDMERQNTRYQDLVIF